MESLMRWLAGDVDQAQRIWSAVWPAIVLGSYFLIGAIIYLIRMAIHGRFRDQEVESRGKSVVIGMGPRQYLAWVMSPIINLLTKIGMPPNAITTIAVLIGMGAGIAIATGRFSLGGWLYMLGGACDFIDGRLARATNQASKAGAALDSILDRYTESVVFVGLAWFYRDSWVLLAVLAALIGSHLIPYVRAKGEAMGVDVKVGTMQRPERLVIIALTVALSPIFEVIFAPDNPKPMHWLAVAGIVVLALGTQFTALHRMFHVVGSLSEKKAAPKRTLKLFGKNAIVAGVATLADFLLVLFLIQRASVEPWLATAVGCVLGGAVNFMLNRVWTFQSDAPPLGQAFRYTIVSATSAFLNAAGVAILMLLPAMFPLVAWVLVRILVFSAWNYPLHAEYVYAPRERLAEQA